VLKNKICLKKFAKPADVHLVGEKNGSVAGMKCIIVARVVRSRSLKSKFGANIEYIKI
jgi:hypothetical protein